METTGRAQDPYYAELKHDGERIMIHKDGDKFSFFSRNRHNFTHEYTADRGMGRTHPLFIVALCSVLLLPSFLFVVHYLTFCWASFDCGGIADKEETTFLWRLKQQLVDTAHDFIIDGEMLW